MLGKKIFYGENEIELETSFISHEWDMNGN